MVWSLGEKRSGRLGIKLQKYGSARKCWIGKDRPRKRWRDVLEDDLKKGRQDRSLAKDRDRRRAQIMGKTSDLCEHGKRDVN